MNEDKIIDSDVDKEVYCNCCGNPIAKTKIAGTHMDYLHIEKLWSYFSSKDLTRHSFNICESCYDRWIADFAIPIEEFPIEEVHLYSEEEIKQLNIAYEQELAK